MCLVLAGGRFNRLFCQSEEYTQVTQTYLVLKVPLSLVPRDGVGAEGRMGSHKTRLQSPAPTQPHPGLVL